MMELAKRFRRAILLGGGAALVVLHLGILWRRVVDGTFLSPQVVAQWGVAGLLVVTAVVLRRRGVSLLRGRSAIAFWIVVALMHGMVALPGGPGFVGVLNTAPATVALPLSLCLVTGALVLLVVLSARPRPSLLHFGPRHAPLSLAFPAGLPPAISPRAPPA